MRRDIAKMRSFRRAEDGSMVIFTMFLIGIMLILGGMAVDIMRFETYRARLQTTLDRAVLAAADLDVCLSDDLDATNVVEDYVSKAGFGEQIVDIQVLKGFNSCSVAVSAELGVNTIFFNRLGIEELSTGAASVATEAVNEIEISLVLDVSGSMRDNSRLVNMRNAARDFNEVMFDSFEPNALTMSVVPYSTQVNLGPALAAQYNLDYEHDFSYCVDLPASTYNSAALNPNTHYPQAAHVDIDSYAYNWGYREAETFVCNPDSSSHVLPFSATEGDIDTMIGGLNHSDWTSIEMGAKWGIALLDPSSQPVLNGLIASGHVNAGFEGRPLDYGTEGVLKIMVLMTDGENTQSYELDTDYRTGDSDVWADGDNYYVQDEEQGNWDYDSRYWEDYYRPQSDDWSNNRYGTRLTWPELWDRINLDAHAWYFRRGQTNNNAVWDDWYNDLFTTTTQATKDSRLNAVCSAAKANGIVIFTIGFEVSNHAAEVMEDCASSPSHFYRVEGLEIANAFSSIASNITTLRLVQ